MSWSRFRSGAAMPTFCWGCSKRLTAYFSALTHSFQIMIEGMEPEQFLQFRMALLPASGFQSAQYRMIEIRATPLQNLQLREKYGSRWQHNLSVGKHIPRCG